MTDREFSQSTYGEIKAVILQMPENAVSNIYALSFYLQKGDDDARQPILTVGYNTIEHWLTCCPTDGQKAEWPVASDADEAKWNFAFWLRNETLVVGGYEYDPVTQWVKNSLYYYTDEQAEIEYDLLGQKIQDQFRTIIIAHAQRLHNEGVIVEKFGRAIPIIVHELEYYDAPVLWTQQANPEGLASEFENWVMSSRL